VVCARFEPSMETRGEAGNQPTLQPVGQVVRLPGSLFDSSLTDDGSAMWVRGEKASEVRQYQAPQVRCLAIVQQLMAV
jgi:hypothetical protein